MFGFSGGEFLVMLIVIAIVVGPQRLPEYTRTVTQWVRQMRLLLENAKQQIAEEVGPELADINLSDLDPRNYDPRKIVREALGEDIEAIRKDFENPIKSVVDAARTSAAAAASGAAEEVSAGTSGKSLKQMIDEKAEETRAARAATAGAAATGAVAATADDRAAETVDEATGAQDVGAAGDAGSVAAQVGDDHPVDSAVSTGDTGESVSAGEADDAGASAAVDGVEDAQEDTAQAPASGDDSAGAAVTAPEVSVSGPAGTRAAEPDEDDEVADPERRALLAGAVDAAGEVVDDVAGILDPDASGDSEDADAPQDPDGTGDRSAPDGSDAPAGNGAPDGAAVARPSAPVAQDPARVPSSLEGTAAPTPGPRPVSPRDIVRAANAAARTRAEAARARVDA